MAVSALFISDTCAYVHQNLYMIVLVFCQCHKSFLRNLIQLDLSCDHPFWFDDTYHTISTELWLVRDYSPVEIAPMTASKSPNA
jgi:hypothetical protein